MRLRSKYEAICLKLRLSNSSDKFGHKGAERRPDLRITILYIAHVRQHTNYSHVQTRLRMCGYFTLYNFIGAAGILEARNDNRTRLTRP